MKKYKAVINKKPITVNVKPYDGSPVLDSQLMAFITKTARSNQYNPDDDPVLKDFRKRMGIQKISSF